MKRNRVICFTLTIILFCCLGKGDFPGFSGTSFAGQGAAPGLGQAETGGAGDGRISVNLSTIAREVVARNATVFRDYLQAQISKEQIRAEKGILEPVLQTAFVQQKLHYPNSTEEILTRRETEYYEKSENFDIGVSGIIPTGAQWALKFLDTRKNSSVIEQYRSYLNEYSNSLRFSLEQPILRGLGFDATMAKMNLAKVQSEIDDSKYEQKLMELVGVTVQVYWRLYGARRIADSWEASLKIAEGALRDIELRFAAGRVSAIDVLEAKSFVDTRRAEALNAGSKVVEAQNQLLTLLNLSASDYRGVVFIPAKSPAGDYVKVLEAEEYIRIALEKWPEFRIAQKLVEKEKLQVKNARDQQLPKLDLVGSLSTSGLGSKRSDSLSDVGEDRFLGWSIGLRLNVPILGNMQATSGLSIAKMRLRQAENDRDSFVKSLSNSIASKTEEMRSFQQQLLEYEKAVTTRERIMEAERAKFRAGRTNLKELFTREEEFINYQRRVLSALVNYRVAEATLEIAMGSILDKYDIDRKNINHGTAGLPTDLRTIFK